MLWDYKTKLHKCQLKQRSSKEILKTQNTVWWALNTTAEGNCMSTARLSAHKTEVYVDRWIAVTLDVGSKNPKYSHFIYLFFFLFFCCCLFPAIALPWWCLAKLQEILSVRMSALPHSRRGRNNKKCIASHIPIHIRVYYVGLAVCKQKAKGSKRYELELYESAV